MRIGGTGLRGLPSRFGARMTEHHLGSRINSGPVNHAAGISSLHDTQSGNYLEVPHIAGGDCEPEL
jgi:hypothetical protein